MKIPNHLFSILGIFVLESCSGVEKAPEQVFEIEISEKKTLDISGSGLSSQFPFKVSPLFENQNAFLMSHSFSRSIDTVFLDIDENPIKKGIEIPYEGPNGIESFNYFFPFADNFLFIDNTTIYIPHNGVVNRKVLGKSLFGIEKGLSFIENSTSPVFILSNPNLKDLYFFSENFHTDQLSLIHYNLEKDSFSDMPFSPLKKIKRHMIQLAQPNGDKLAKVNNAFKPGLLVTDLGCIISYPFCADFQFFNFSSKKTEIFEPNSEMFKGEKREPEIIPGDMDLPKFLTISKTWSDDIEFGPIYRLENNSFFRIVRGELIEGKSSKFLELFDSSFEKIQEIDLSSLETDLSFFYFPLGNRIFIKAADQPDEDLLNYYLIQIKGK